MKDMDGDYCPQIQLQSVSPQKVVRVSCEDTKLVLVEELALKDDKVEHVRASTGRVVDRASSTGDQGSSRLEPEFVVEKASEPFKVWIILLPDRNLHDHLVDSATAIRFMDGVSFRIDPIASVSKRVRWKRNAVNELIEGVLTDALSSVSRVDIELDGHSCTGPTLSRATEAIVESLRKGKSNDRLNFWQADLGRTRASLCINVGWQPALDGNHKRQFIFLNSISNGQVSTCSI